MRIMFIIAITFFALTSCAQDSIPPVDSIPKPVDTIPKPNFVRVDTVQGVFQYINTNGLLVTDPAIRIDSVWKEYINNVEYAKWRQYRSLQGKVFNPNKWFLFLSKSEFQ